jgi:uncharacterized membrane protein
VLRAPGSRLATALLALLASVAVATAAGVVALWPGDPDIAPAAGARSQDLRGAEVVAVDARGCRAVGQTDCRRITVELSSGPDRGQTTAMDVSGVEIQTGDRVRVIDNRLPPGATVAGLPADRYAFSDFERRSPLLWLTLAFVAIVLITGRLRGLRALVGLAFSLGVVVLFVVPAILNGGSPLAVATFGALAIMLVTIPLAHGLGPKTVAACLGTTAALLITLALAVLFTDLAHITGFGSEEAVFLRASSDDLSLQGLLLAGIVIGALGVLDDLTVSQSSTVMALRRADPTMGARDLYREAMAVGRDHLTATVNTLVLAYAGASLPVLLVFSLADTSFGTAVNSEAVAAEIVATLVGSIGLIAAVPITTALAALLAVRLDARAIPAGGHTH